MVDLTLKVAVPSADDARVGHRIVGHRWLFVVRVPVFAENSGEVATFSCVDVEIADFDTVNHV